MANFILSAFADEYSPSLEGQLDGLKKAGISTIEPRFIDGRNISEISEKEATRVAKILEEKGVSTYSVGSPIGKISLDGNHTAHAELAHRTLECAAILGASRVRIFSYYIPNGNTRADCRAEVIDRLGRLTELAEGYGITLCHENEAGIYGEAPEHCRDILDALGGRLRAVFDMGNFALGGYDPVAAYRLLYEYIDYFHIKDSLRAGAIVPPGLGEAHIADILAEYSHSTDRRTVLTLEPHLETFSGLGRLTGSTFDNPYKYDTQESAFLDAAKRLRIILEKL